MVEHGLFTALYYKQIFAKLFKDMLMSNLLLPIMMDTDNDFALFQ